jgi:hypothetical protein
MGLLPFLERAIAATLWTLGAGAVATIIGLVIGSYEAASRAEGVTLGLRYGQLIAVGFCPAVLWWRVYRTMWLRGPRRSAEAREPRVATSGSTSLIREPPVKARSTPQTKPEEPIEKAEKPRPKREPRVRREPTSRQKGGTLGGRSPQRHMSMWLHKFAVKQTGHVLLKR